MKIFGVRDIAMRAVGRNVVNFQKLEQCLKALVCLDNLSGSMSTVQGAVAKRVSNASRYTLGRAVQEWFRVTTLDKTPKSTQDLFEPWISISFGLPIDPERLAEHSEALNTLASKRNNLVHQALANINFDSDEGCQNLIADLDHQNARILEQLAFLAPAIRALVELNKWTVKPESQDELFDAFTNQQNINKT